MPDGRYTLAATNADSNSGVAAGVAAGGSAGGAMASGNTCAGSQYPLPPTNGDYAYGSGTFIQRNGGGAANNNRNLMASNIGGSQAQHCLSVSVGGVGNVNVMPTIVARRIVGTSNTNSSDRVDYVPGGGHLGEYLGDCLPRDPCEMCEKLSVQLGRPLDANHSRASCPNKQLYKATFGSNGFGNEFGM